MQERESGAGENGKHIVMYTYLVQVTLSVALTNITPPNTFLVLLDYTISMRQISCQSMLFTL